MKNDNNVDLSIEDENVESLKPRWWRPFWILTVISMVGSGVFSYFFLHRDFIRIIIYEIIFSIILGIAYYIRIKPSKRVNKVVYILLGTIPIGFGLYLVYGLTGIMRFLINLGIWWFNLIVFIILLVIGGFIGNQIGKKRDYILPFSLRKQES
jgi:hypothetical protein